MDERIHPGDREGGRVDLLAEEAERRHVARKLEVAILVLSMGLE
jgi:hypothetical protein